jgi:UDP-N-acetylmuramate dehydrogenase
MAKRDLRRYFGDLYMQGADIRLEEPMSWHTTIRIGGRVPLFVSPYSVDSMVKILKLVESDKIPHRLIGGGSNVVCPEHYGGIVLSTAHLNAVRIDGTSVTAQAGVSVNTLVWFCLSEGLTGLEFLTGLPGTVGGAVYMNAGAFGGEIGSLVKSVEYVDENYDLHSIEGSLCRFGYRYSLFKERSYKIMNVEFSLAKGRREAIESKMCEILRKRLEKQPLDLPSAGSVFVRPYQDFFVGSTIEKIGLKTLSVGDAQVSSKHAGFIVNRGKASYADVVLLIEKLKESVFEATGVTLSTEIELWREVE